MVFGQQVDALGAHCLCLDHKARHESLACGEHHLAIGFGSLVRRAADRDLAVLLRLHGLHQHLEGLADPLLGPLRGQLLGQLGDVGEALRDGVGVELVLVADRLGALLVRIPEDADRVEAGTGEEAFQLGEVGLGLAGEADDEVGAGTRLGALLRMVSRSSRKRSVSPKRRMARSTPGAECWKERSKYGATFGVEVRTSMRPGRISAGWR